LPAYARQAVTTMIGILADATRVVD